MYIYKITNKSTHQCYIGQTKSFIKRWEGHCCRNETPIQKAIKKEGIANFTFEVLEECLEEKADERECYWIEYYHAYTEGYNTNRGNLKNESTKKEQVKIKNVPISKKDNRGSSFSPDGVDAYDPKTGKFVKHYSSIAEANRDVGTPGTGNISAVCRGRGQTAYGFIWKYTNKIETEE